MPVAIAATVKLMIPRLREPPPPLWDRSLQSSMQALPVAPIVVARDRLLVMINDSKRAADSRVNYRRHLNDPSILSPGQASVCDIRRYLYKGVIKGRATIAAACFRQDSVATRSLTPALIRPLGHQPACVLCDKFAGSIERVRYPKQNDILDRADNDFLRDAILSSMLSRLLFPKARRQRVAVVCGDWQRRHQRNGVDP